MNQNDSANVLRFFQEGHAYIERHDPVQASEKLYKAAEEAVKSLAARFQLPQWAEAVQKERWTVSLLFSAVRSLQDRTNRDEVLNGWHAAWFLHVEGFHEARLDIEEVKMRLPLVEGLVNLADSETL